VRRNDRAVALLHKSKNPPEAGSLNMVPEPGQKCREHFCIVRQHDPKGVSQDVARVSNVR